MTVFLTQEKKAKLKLLCLEALEKRNLIIRFVAQVIGKIVSSLPVVEFGRFQYRHFERDKIHALSRSHGDYIEVTSWLVSADDFSSRVARGANE